MKPFPRFTGLCLTFAALIAFSGEMPRARVAAQGASLKEGRGTGAAANGASQRHPSKITGISVAGSQPAGTFAGVPYTRVWGTITGVVASGENVHGLGSLPHDGDGNYEYKSEFELFAPAKSGMNSVIVVDAENRGNTSILKLNEVAASAPPSSAAYPTGMGNGFLFEHATSY